ncbi:MAG TPA: exopolysaccharide biosynthesis polyprenyl glycosylphosphotransferase [Acetobacteraceae bacterium]|jgi:Undecaprenyl-phosphate glucose phosphotransferase|nr:exopolysaccharide biosynthesis polyprenyl glycosylphosphotransferase [Acetobacteraceae bacterium]
MNSLPKSATAFAVPKLLGRPNLVTLAAIACASEAFAVLVAVWLSAAVESAFVPHFLPPQLWFRLVVALLLMASIAERGDYATGVMLDCGLRPWSLAKASLQAAGAVLLFALPPILVAPTLLLDSGMPFGLAGINPGALTLWVFLFIAISYCTVILVRLAGRAACAPLARPRRVAIVGDARECDGLVRSFKRQSHRSMQLLGVFDDTADGPSPGVAHSPPAGDTPILGRLDALADMVRKGKVDVVIAAPPSSDEDRIGRIVELVGSAPVDVLLSPGLGMLGLPVTPTADYASVPLLRAIYPPLLGWQVFLKRAEDLAIAGMITLIVAPAMVSIAVLIKLTSRGPVFFRQKRFGYKGEMFEALKFRTMYTHLADPLGAQQTMRGDPRITPLGRWLRRTSLDELPQLLNVLRGDMSLVGPRPHPIGMTASGIPLNEATPAYRLRQRVRPGLTGWAQVNGNRGPLHTCAEVENRVTLDLEYIRDWSLAFDLKIIWLTVRLLIKDEGAY